MKTILIAYVILINLLGFCMMGADKRKARKKKWRIPERTLFLTALLFGSIGILVGMYVFRHKTKHLSFTIGIPAILVVQLLLISLLLSWNSKRMGSPSQAVQYELSLIQKLDADTIESFVSYENLTAPHVRSGTVGQEAAEAVALFFQHFRYSIHNEQIEGDQATVSVNITNIDTHALAQDLCASLLRQSAVLFPSSEDLMPADYYRLLRDTLASHTYEPVVTTAWFHLQKDEAGWVILADEALEDELVSGFISWMRDPFILPASEVLAIHLDAFRALDAQQWQEYLGFEDLFATCNTDYSGQIDAACAEAIASSYDYEILKCSENGSNASATVRITGPDMPAALARYKSSLLAYASTPASIRDSAVQTSNETARLLLLALQETKETRATDVDLQFHNDGSAWAIYFDKSFTNALLGDMDEAIDAFSSLSQAGDSAS